MTTRKQKKAQERWRWSTGSRPHTAAVEERTPGGVIYGRVWDPQARRWCRQSLKHRDKDRAKAWALEQAAKLAKGDTAIRAGKVTLAMVCAAYEKHRTPRKTKGVQKADERRAEMWKAVLGADRDPHTIRMSDWERFIDLRSSGAIDARGREVPPKERRPVRARAVEPDCSWLRWVFNWASKWRMQSGTTSCERTRCAGTRRHAKRTRGVPWRHRIDLRLCEPSQTK